MSIKRPEASLQPTRFSFLLFLFAGLLLLLLPVILTGPGYARIMKSDAIISPRDSNNEEINDYGEINDYMVIQGSTYGTRWLYFNDAHNALYHHLVDEILSLMEERSRIVSAIQTPEEWQQRQLDIKKILDEIVGPFPERTPLNARILRTIEKSDYRIEHIVFESQPRFFVTSSLYLPRNLTAPAPAILYLSGHAQEGYRSRVYQHTIINLVKKGFIVFAFDPLGQGEREEYYDASAGRSLVGSATREHSYAGAQVFMNGSSLARYMTWDGMRALDYLLSRSEVDSGRIGVTGRSGGGTQTAYLAAMDSRIHAAAPEAYFTNFRELYQRIGTPDAEQIPYHGAARGFDLPDFLSVRAPAPTLIITTSNDYFNIQGAIDTFKEVSGIYESFGQSENLSMVEDIGEHESTPANRQAMYAFFQKHLELPGRSDDKPVSIPDDENLRVTPTGQVASSFGGETVYSLNHKEAENRMQSLQASRRNLQQHLSEVTASAKILSGYRDPGNPPAAVRTGRHLRQGYVLEKYFLPGEGDYVLPFLLLIPVNSNGKAAIYLDPEGKFRPCQKGGAARNLALQGYTVLVPDMLGLGELGPPDMANYVTRVEPFDPVPFDVWGASVLIGRSITGIRAGDTVRLARWLQNTRSPKQILGFARGDMAPVLLHAAVFEPGISSVTLEQPYVSYRAVVTERFYNPAFHISAIPGAIGVYDLPDLAAALAPRELGMYNITDGTGRVVRLSDLEEDLHVIRKAYEQAGAAGRLHLFQP